MKLSSLRTGPRPLFWGVCGAVLVITALLIALGLGQLSSLDSANGRIIDQGWDKAEAAHAVNALTRANARRVLELFLITDKDKIAQTQLAIETNKQIITEKLAMLDRIAESEREKHMMAAIRRTRAAYVASFSEVITLLSADKRGQAATLMNEQTLPTLDQLQRQLEAMLQLQRHLVEEHADAARQHVVQAVLTLFGLCLIGVLASIGVANLVSLGIRRQQRAIPLRDGAPDPVPKQAGSTSSSTSA
ncbi:MAG: MCP four helix bundle domain-containing protein [Massilia sp.]